MKEYAIFDLDGTLIDSFECICRNINKTLLYFDCPTYTKSQFEEYRYEELSKLFSFVVKATNGKVSMPSFKSIFDKMHFDDCIDGVTVIETTKCILNDMKQKGLGIIVLTNKKQEIAEKICEKFFIAGTFDIIIGRDDKDTIKTINVILQRFQELFIDIQDCTIYYGNSEIDKSLAQELKINFIQIH